MRIATISSGGQISIPADIRHRWGVRRVLIRESEGALVIRPLPDDPIKAAMGILRRRPGEPPGPSASDAIAQVREEEDLVYRRRGWS
jgi:bifunctional DNA-binding transcriptional regulator/antitoxin component of YhaV-PrlF toxin-antitoxin module